MKTLSLTVILVETFFIYRAFMHSVLSKLIFHEFNRICVNNCYIEIDHIICRNLHFQVFFHHLNFNSFIYFAFFKAMSLIQN